MRRRSAIRLRSGLACLSRSSYSLIRVPCQLMSSSAGSWMPSIVASSDWMDRIRLSISCSVRYWFCPCWGWASSAISASMANEELRALVLQFFPRRPSRVPEEGRVVGGGTLIGGCAKLRRVRVRSAWSENSGEAFPLAGRQRTEQQRCLLGADADHICAFVDGERRRPVFHQRRLHPPHAAELAGVVAAETAAGDSRVGAGEFAAEGVGGDRAFPDRFEDLVGGGGLVVAGAGEQAPSVSADLLRDTDRHRVALRWRTEDRHAVVEQHRDAPAALGAAAMLDDPVERGRVDDLLVFTVRVADRGGCVEHGGVGVDSAPVTA